MRKEINNKIKGKTGEDIAVNYLKNLGYEIIERNFRTEVGEIDIIAASEGYLIFLEVKMRKDTALGYPAEAVNALKIKKITQVASQYINKYNLFDIDVRFDVIEVFFEEKKVNHIKNAFESYLSF